MPLTYQFKTATGMKSYGTEEKIYYGTQPMASSHPSRMQTLEGEAPTQPVVATEIDQAVQNYQRICDDIQAELDQCTTQFQLVHAEVQQLRESSFSEIKQEYQKLLAVSQELQQEASSHEELLTQFRRLDSLKRQRVYLKYLHEIPILIEQLRTAIQGVDLVSCRAAFELFERLVQTREDLKSLSAEPTALSQQLDATIPDLFEELKGALIGLYKTVLTEMNWPSAPPVPTLSELSDGSGTAAHTGGTSPKTTVRRRGAGKPGEKKQTPRRSDDPKHHESDDEAEESAVTPTTTTTAAAAPPTVESHDPTGYSRLVLQRLGEATKLLVGLQLSPGAPEFLRPQPPGSASPVVTSSHWSAANPPAHTPLPVVLLLEPILTRMKYHFEGDRATNQREKPEYLFHWAVHTLATHRTFFVMVVTDQLTSAGWPCDAAALFTDALTSRLVLKLTADLTLLVETALAPPMPADFDAIAMCLFEMRLRSKLGGSPPGLMRVWTEDMFLFQQWLKAEKQAVMDKLQEVMTTVDAWEPKVRPSHAPLAAPAFVIGVSGVGAASLLSEHYALLPIHLAHQFFRTVQLPVLERFLPELRRRVDLLPTQPHPQWAAHCTLLNSLAAMQQVLTEWGSEPVFLELLVFAKQHQLQHPSAAGGSGSASTPALPAPSPQPSPTTTPSLATSASTEALPTPSPSPSPVPSPTPALSPPLLDADLTSILSNVTTPFERDLPLIEGHLQRGTQVLVQRVVAMFAHDAAPYFKAGPGLWVVLDDTHVLSKNLKNLVGDTQN
ncbi:putative RAD50-interacting protein 1 [Paratrimastix pyriformis]|uniref:RAD50-interacting protein 1 n=1 Tax=Paratrimastix pyriformis TaxID=342808 RepID=A0ABQ8UML3_9EUKA|nr:putative RAD50-interacting protein 1 [Paratrimastix pyriformis]